MPLEAIATERLLLRAWADRDLSPFAALNADPETMRFFPAPLSRVESDALVGRIRSHVDRHGFGLWAVELRETGSFLGFTGLSIPAYETPFTPCVEIGWRFARHAWGRGFATEAARAALGHGFGKLGLAEIVSFTSALNLPSIRLMQRIGMTTDPAEDFDHPRVPEGHPLRRHVLYRIRPPSRGRDCRDGASHLTRLDP